MNFYLHISIHILLSLLAGTIVFLFYRSFWASVIPALLSGVAVDSDHFIDYFSAFGFHFNYGYFINGYQFLKTDRIHIWFHAWEYVVILIIIAVLLKNNVFKAIFFSLTLGLFFHLSADCLLNEGMKIKSYSLAYRIKNNFNVEQLVTAQHWQRHIGQKSVVLPLIDKNQ